MRIFLAAIIILILGLLDVLEPFRAVFQRITLPVQYGLQSIAADVKDTYYLFSDLDQIRKENLELLEENQELRSSIVDFKQAEEENKLLRDQLDLKNEEFFDKELLLALVMGNPKDLTGTSLVLDKGNRQGVAVGDNVVRGNVLVGIVTEVSAERSIMDLIVSPHVSMTVTNVDSEVIAEGLAHGDQGTSVRVTRLLPGEDVKEDDVFVTSGKDGRFLPGLSVGRVSKVTFESADPLKSAILEPLVDLYKIEKVFIILTS